VKITKLKIDPIENYPYWIVQTGYMDEKGNREIEKVNLPILLGAISDLGQDLDAIVATSDLQGIIKDNDIEYLLGIKLPEFLSMFIQLELPNIDTKKIRVILCGDLYANLDKRGGRGDVKDVWREFNKYFKWVIGVAGNHDDFGETKEFEAFKKEDNIYYLHGQIKEIDKIKFGGISGIIGRTDKPQRVEEKAYLITLKKLLVKQPSMILLHQSPNALDEAIEHEGNEEIRKIIEGSPSNLIFCGHSHWKKPIITFNNDTQIVNLDGRVVILIKDSN
jgi:Icc-related predicted phosphoesterase